MNKGEERIKLFKENNKYIEDVKIELCNNIIEIPICKRYNWIVEYIKDYKVTGKVENFLSSLY